MTIPYLPELPKNKIPIMIIGAGSIVKDAHLPAYRQAGFEVVGITNRNRAKAEELASSFGISHVYHTLEEALPHLPKEVVFDLTLPANYFAEYLLKLPDGALVLIQKPIGETMEQAKEILRICRQKKLRAAVNFQLRFAPFVIAAKYLIDRGVIGDLYDMEARVTVQTPWDHFEFLKNVPRLEIVYHSVHYIDCIRHFLGNPKGIYAKTLRHPKLSSMAESRSSLILDYGESVRANIQTNHFHEYGSKHQESYIKWEGSKGAIKAKLGLLMNYPKGVPDLLEYATKNAKGEYEWQEIPVKGSWFPEAFIGTMSQMMRLQEGSDSSLCTSVEDCIHTMACVEAAYASSLQGGVSPQSFYNL